MTSLVVALVISLIILWLLVMYSLWVRQRNLTEETVSDLAPLYNKGTRFLRRFWFLFLRKITVLREIGTVVATKIFFTIFPKAKKAFQQRDQLTGLSHGPSSYFLKSISEYRAPSIEEIKKNRRKRKKV